MNNLKRSNIFQPSNIFQDSTSSNALHMTLLHPPNPPTPPSVYKNDLSGIASRLRVPRSSGEPPALSLYIYIHTVYNLLYNTHIYTIYIYISVYNSLIHIYTCASFNRIPPSPYRILHPLPLGPGDFADPLVAKIHRAEGITSSDQPGITNFGNADFMWPCYCQEFGCFTAEITQISGPSRQLLVLTHPWDVSRPAGHRNRRAKGPACLPATPWWPNKGDWRNGFDVFIKWI